MARKFYVLEPGPQYWDHEGIVWYEPARSERLTWAFVRSLVDSEPFGYRRCIVPHRYVYQQWDRCLDQLVAELPGRRLRDFLWATDCGNEKLAMPEKTLELFVGSGITGFVAYPLAVERIKWYKGTDFPKLWMMQITGKAGMDSPPPGRHYGQKCPVCGCYYDYSNQINGYYVDEGQWDGSDFCRLDTEMNLIIISERVKDLIVEHELKECMIVEAEHYPHYLPMEHEQPRTQECLQRARDYEIKVWGSLPKRFKD